MKWGPVALALTAGAVSGWLAHLLAQRIVLSRAVNTGIAVREEQDPAERMVYALSFPDGSPVVPGRFQEWLDLIRDDPDIPPEEYMIAKTIIKKLRARFNLKGGDDPGTALDAQAARHGGTLQKALPGEDQAVPGMPGGSGSREPAASAGA